MIATPSIEAFLKANPQLVPHITNAMPVDLISPRDVSNAVLYLVSDEGRHVTGTMLSVDAGFSNKNRRVQAVLDVVFIDRGIDIELCRWAQALPSAAAVPPQ